MSKLTIIEIPDPRLKVKAEPVERVDESVVRLMEDMLETMYAAPGIGLAAPQVGVSRRVIVADIAPEGAPRAPLRMANPEVLWASGEIQVSNEGCLSVPEQYADVERPRRIRVRYLDHRNETREMEAANMLATVILHEMDHLDGVLFVDRISKLKRDIVLRRLFKARRTKQPSAL
ncbi:MAG: peptide deformylase [Alphaproteobacteria bacterium]|nr:peptide deformylase [Alphaproteobacteria bacterium]MBF0128457.1 peptide deformylase [Alphaproteobacteria bacterium]